MARAPFPNVARRPTLAAALIGLATTTLGCRGDDPSGEAHQPAALPTSQHDEIETPETRAQRVRIAWLPSPVARFCPLFERAGRIHGVDPELLAIVALVESGGWSRARSPSGARGLMQIMPTTGRIIANERSLETPDPDGLLETARNVDFGAWYLARQLERFGSGDPNESAELAAAAYNGGPTHLTRHLADGAPLAAQTARYRRWVGGMWRERRAARSATFQAWLDAGGARLLARGQAEMGRGEALGRDNP